MFKTPVSTIRDVAELTEAPPNLIARILGEMRGPAEFEKLYGLVVDHSRRLTDIELRVSILQNQDAPSETLESSSNPKNETELSDKRPFAIEEESLDASWLENQRKSMEEQEIRLDESVKAARLGAYFILAAFMVWLIYAHFTPNRPPENFPFSPVIR